MRDDPDPGGSELALLGEYLDYQRETMLSKTDGLTREHLARKHPPSELTLAGLLYHLALVEEDWMEVRFSGLPEREPWASVDWDADPNWEFRTATDFGPEQLHSRYREACRRSRHIVAQAEGLDQLSIKALRDGDTSRCGGCYCTSSRRPPATLVTQISSAKQSTAQSASNKLTTSSRR